MFSANSITTPPQRRCERRHGRHAAPMACPSGAHVRTPPDLRGISPSASLLGQRGQAMPPLRRPAVRGHACPRLRPCAADDGSRDGRARMRRPPRACPVSLCRPALPASTARSPRHDPATRPRHEISPRDLATVSSGEGVSTRGRHERASLPKSPLLPPSSARPRALPKEHVRSAGIDVAWLGVGLALGSGVRVRVRVRVRSGLGLGIGLGEGWAWGWA